MVQGAGSIPAPDTQDQQHNLVESVINMGKINFVVGHVTHGEREFRHVNVTGSVVVSPVQQGTCDFGDCQEFATVLIIIAEKLTVEIRPFCDDHRGAPVSAGKIAELPLEWH
jgi:hypothetical protein